MAELSTLARPYAKAVFEYAEGADALESWSDTLELLASVVTEPTLKQWLSNPDHTTEQQSSTVVDICGDALGDKGQNLVRLLAANRRLQLLPFIGEQFEALKLQRLKSVDVELVTATALQQDQQDKLAKALSEKLSRSVNVTVSIDESLLGGVLIRAGDTIIDGSIRGRLTKLSEALNS